MKKVTLFLLFVVATVFSSQAQSFQKSDKLLNVGIGVGTYYAGGLPIGASLEVGVTDQISVGGAFDYSRYGYNVGTYRSSWNFFYVGARGSYHLGELLDLGNDKFDPYAGLTLGFRAATYTDNIKGNDAYEGTYGSGVYLGIHAGGRYMFNQTFGGFGELGYGVSVLKLGLTAKF